MTRAEMLAVRQLQREWDLTEFPDEATANQMRLDLARVIAALARQEGEAYDVTQVDPTIPDLTPEERARREAAWEGEWGGAEVAAVEAVLADFDTWKVYETRDIGPAFLAESVIDMVTGIRAALADSAGALAKHDAELTVAGFVATLPRGACGHLLCAGRDRCAFLTQRTYHPREHS